MTPTLRLVKVFTRGAGYRRSVTSRTAASPSLTRACVLRAAVLGGPLLALGACAGGDESAAPAGSESRSASPSAGASSSPSDVAGERVPERVRPRVARTLASGLAVPWGIAFLPSGDALVSMRDTGAVFRVLRRGGTTEVGAVPDIVSSLEEGGEGGLLGLALHPAYPREPWLYAYRTTASGNEVVRMRLRGSRPRLGAPQVVLDEIATSLHHNGGGLVFGPDGHLYVSTGDAEDKPSAQDTASLNGKVLRVTDTGRVPRDNPFGNAVWSYGHRNVEGLTFDGGGRLWASEFGDQEADELNRIDRGGNYGWPAAEGDSGGAFVDPLATWPPDDCSPSGVAVLAGRAWLGALQGRCVYAVRLTGPQRGQVERVLEGDRGRIRLVAAAPDGSLWVGTSNRDGRAEPGSQDDRILRVTL